MNRAQAIAQVAAHAAAFLRAGTFEEATGVSEELVSPADARRLEEAVGEVIRRLYKMGGSGGQ